jgi:hypothetical protein
MNQGNKIQKTTVQVCHTELMMMMIVSMGWDHVSELRSPTRLLFIPRVVYEHGEP